MSCGDDPGDHFAPPEYDHAGFTALERCPPGIRALDPLRDLVPPTEAAHNCVELAGAVAEVRAANGLGRGGERGLVVVLKGQGTLVTDGRRLFCNPSGNPGMATAGSGDVLTGVVAAFLGQGLDAFAAAQLGAYLHGLAGDCARDRIGEISVIATDLIDYLPPAIQQYQQQPHAH